MPGRVLATGKPTWIPDVEKDANFPRAKMAENIGVHAGFGFPILAAKEVVGVLEFYSAEASEPNEALLAPGVKHAGLFQEVTVFEGLLLRNRFGSSHIVRHSLYHPGIPANVTVH